MDKSDLFVILSICCLALAGFYASPVAGFLALALGFGFFAVASHDADQDGDA